MKDKIIVIAFLLIIFSLGILQFCIKDQELSKIERRRLTTMKDVYEDFPNNLENYLSDQIPLRESFLKLNQIWNRSILRNKEHNNLYIQDDFLIEKLYPLNESSKNNFIKKINDITSKYLSGSNCFFALIPDKSFFLNDPISLKINHEKLMNDLEATLEIPFINTKNTFTLTDYFKTDIHLKQEAYFKFLPLLQKSFHLEDLEVSYTEKNVSNFKGSSFYKAPYSSLEDLTFYESDITKNAIVSHLEYQNNLIYEEMEEDTLDMYNIFLNGPSSLINITNPAATNEKELILFRDSFASSLAPLLLPFYKKITLIDLRYIKMDYVANLVDFQNKDVLFIYSPLIINNSSILK
jgi:hypothetical protein